MCYRYYIGTNIDLEERFSTIPFGLDIQSNYNVSVLSSMPIIVNKSQGREINIAKWGLIPSWSKDNKYAAQLANTRNETIDEKPSFRESFMSRRCLIPASGFFEWEKANGESIPYAVRMKKEDIFAFAGLFNYWSDPQGQTIQTYSIITTNANKLISQIHDRMPVILQKSQENLWLDPTQDASILKGMLLPIDEELIEMFRVSTDVNSPKNNNKSLIEKI